MSDRTEPASALSASSSLTRFLELPPGPGDVLAPVQQGHGQLGVVVLVLDQRERLQDGLEPPGRGRGVPGLGELAQVAGDVPVVPGDQDRLDVREVLVQRGPADPGRGGDLQHRHRRQSVLADQRRGGVQGGVVDRAPVLLDRLGPQLRHPLRIHDVDIETNRIDSDTLSR